jgi:replicative DNA helicase
MIYRDEMYNEDTQDKGVAEILIRKNREGETGTVYLATHFDLSRFDNLTYQYIKQPQQPTRRGGGFDYLDR